MKSQLCETAAMNKLQELERVKMHRKLLKPQVERQRRERMNRSLENLRILLLHGHEQQSMCQKRMEKAEILEHTVLFLQSSITEAKKSRTEDDSSPQAHQFLDGFSTCLQKAAYFLHNQSETQGLHHSLSSSLFQCLNRPHRPAVKDITQRQGARRHTHSLALPYRIPLRHTDPNTTQNHHRNTTRATQPTNDAQAAGGQCVWRPWP